MERKFKNGDIVKYSPKWCTAEESSLIHIVIEDCLLNPVSGGNRYKIETQNGKVFLGHLLPVEVVNEEMIIHA